MSIIDDAKSLAKLLQDIGRMDLYQKMVNLQGEIIDLKEDNVKLHEENIQLKEKIKVKDNLVFDGNKYWLKKEEGEVDGPFCSKCYDVHGNLVRSQKESDPQYYRCPECRESIEKEPGYRPHFDDNQMHSR